MGVDELGLVGVALEIATEFAGVFPRAVFTSGRRALEDQARAMAENVMLNRRWVNDTYVAGDVARALQTWVDTKRMLTQAICEAGFLSILKQFGDSELRHLTRHLAGEAFDVRPCADVDQHIWLACAAERVGGKFLEQEGHLVRWHWQAP